MKSFTILFRRLRVLFSGEHLDRDLDEEMQFHLEMQAEEYKQGGLEAAEAKYAARRRFGSPARLGEFCREVWGWDSVLRLWQDLRYAARTLVKSPGFAAVAIATLALGIGANTTIFSVVAALQLRPLPFRDAGRLVVLNEAPLKNPRWRRNPALSTALHIREQNHCFQQVELAVAYSEPGKIRIGGRMEQLPVQFVSPDLLSLLGIQPVLGRSFRPEDVTFSDGTAILISHALWRERFGGDPHVLGKTVATGDHNATIIGVLPPGAWVFPWQRQAEVWSAINLRHNVLTPDTRWFTVLARLRPGVSVEQAGAEMAALGSNLAHDHPETNRDWTISVQDLHRFYFRGLRQEMYLLLGAVGFVLLIACANVANLLLVRATGRQKEIAIRASLGASHLRIVRQLLTESIMLGVLGGLGGILLSILGIRIFIALAPAWVAGWQQIRIDGTVLGFALLVSVATGILFGLTPSIRASSPKLNETLKEAGDASGGAPRQFGRSVLIVVEIGLTVILLTGAGLMVNSFLRLRGVDPGFNVKNLLTAQIHLIDPKYRELLPADVKRVKPAADQFFRDVSERLAKVPGIRAAATEGMETEADFRILGQPDLVAGQRRMAVFSEVSADFLRALQIPLRSGRMLNERDADTSPKVAVVNESMVRRYFDGNNPLGKMISVNLHANAITHTAGEDYRQIVGVIGDIRADGVEPSAIFRDNSADRVGRGSGPGGHGYREHGRQRRRFDGSMALLHARVRHFLGNGDRPRRGRNLWRDLVFGHSPDA